MNLKAGQSHICLCTHEFRKHSSRSKSSNHCKIFGCNCRQFNSTDSTVVSEVVYKMRRLGFTSLNNKALCLLCNEYIDAGYWHDTFIFIRLREHLITHHMAKRCLTPSTPTG